MSQVCHLAFALALTHSCLCARCSHTPSVLPDTGACWCAHCLCQPALQPAGHIGCSNAVGPVQAARHQGGGLHQAQCTAWQQRSFDLHSLASCMPSCVNEGPCTSEGPNHSAVYLLLLPPVQVFATGPTAHGLISESFIGTAAPNTAAGPLPGCDNLVAGLDMVARCATRPQAPCWHC